MTNTPNKILYDTFDTHSQAEICIKGLKLIWACGSKLMTYPKATAAEIVDAGPCLHEVWLILSE